MCIHTKRDLLDFFIIVVNIFVPFFAGMIAGRHWYGLLCWSVIAFIFFGYFEALILCRHCPHYKEKGKTLRCHANWGLPKIPAYDPRPMNSAEQVVWLISASIIMFYWIPFFIIAQQWLFLAWGLTSSVVSIYQMLRTKCSRCFILSCPLNRVTDDMRQAIYKYYPIHRP